LSLFSHLVSRRSFLRFWQNIVLDLLGVHERLSLCRGRGDNEMLLSIKGRERGEEERENTIKRDKRETVTEYRMKGGKERKIPEMGYRNVKYREFGWLKSQKIKNFRLNGDSSARSGWQF